MVVVRHVGQTEHRLAAIQHAQRRVHPDLGPGGH
jgi:hypothetical protein